MPAKRVSDNFDDRRRSEHADLHRADLGSGEHRIELLRHECGRHDVNGANRLRVLCGERDGNGAPIGAKRGEGLEVIAKISRLGRVGCYVHVYWRCRSVGDAPR